MHARSFVWIIIAVVAMSRPTRGVCEDLDAPDPVEMEKNPSSYTYKNDLFTIRLGGGLLIDYATYSQDAASKEQMNLGPETGIRDLRLLVSGMTPWSRLTYTLGYALVESEDSWRFRQTGLVLQVPELGGFLFLGRTKEGFSTNKFMVGYYGWFNERSAANDAFLPILADGARWTAHALGNKLVYNIGAFADPLSQWEGFNKNDWTFAARAVWLPLAKESETTAISENQQEGMGTERAPTNAVLHLAVEGRYAGADDGHLRYRSKPESFFAQSQAVDTGFFDASRSTMLGVEAYYVNGPFSSGTEYYFNWVQSTPANDPFFHGGDAFVAYMFTGETHPYSDKAGYFEMVSPKKSVFDGGPGAWELAFRGSYADFDSGPINGGRWFRVTPLINWYVSDVIRLEAAYGYSLLDRFDLTGVTQYFQTRIQLAVK